jgi:hypothetical protein
MWEHVRLGINTPLIPLLYCVHHSSAQQTILIVIYVDIYIFSMKAEWLVVAQAERKMTTREKRCFRCSAAGAGRRVAAARRRRCRLFQILQFKSSLNVDVSLLIK